MSSVQVSYRVLGCIRDGNQVVIDLELHGELSLSAVQSIVAYTMLSL